MNHLISKATALLKRPIARFLHVRYKTDGSIHILSSYNQLFSDSDHSSLSFDFLK